MHHCLSISELVENICNNLQGVEQGRRTLAALARTCRSFHDPALNCLWAIQATGMVNLMHCMPPDLFEFSDNGHIRVLRPILLEDWERPLVHMRRIRTLICSGITNIPAVSALCASFPGDAGPLFPKLTSLHWGYDWRPEDPPSLHVLFSPRLTSLTISAPLSNIILSDIPRTCPALKYLDVYSLDVDYGGVDRSAISTFLRDLHSLESLEIVVPDLATLEHLSQLPCLASLIARLPDDLPLPSNPLSFIALELLVIRYEVEPVIHFLQRCDGVPLKSIIIELDMRPTTAAIDRLYTALREGCSHTSLRSLAIDIEDDELLEPGDNAHATNLESLRLLFCFVNTTSISLASYAEFNIDDHGMKELALAWPQIRELRLKLEPWYADLQRHPKFSLRCLRILAEHCQALTDLEITLNATVIPELGPDLGTRPVSQSALRNLDVGKSPITSPSLHVARYVSDLFPSVSELTTNRTYCKNDDPEELEDHAEAIAHHRLWMEVADQLPSLKATREEER
ncbi:hypothetical protein MSAN_01230300 [Mycena sanguinolenta]|uniref:F-box domain-containing protein n=1 Tax=Mycena sanguinolenta TaxID=230812 RepID=A0A8H7D2C1_9AGAR|nr:hypothetical protein MSAN_01230300 [Mycena sanguinolenta]